MVAYTIRYRFNGPGPAVLLVECEGMLRMYSRGRISAPLTERDVAALLDGRVQRWVPASGELTSGAGELPVDPAEDPPTGVASA
jgi:hypothetical protein